jgi:hypothetical protein
MTILSEAEFHDGVSSISGRFDSSLAAALKAQTDAIGAAFDSAASPIVLSTTGTNPYVEEYIVLQVGASGGTLAFEWAQVTTNGAAYTVLEGSHIEYATS